MFPPINGTHIFQISHPWHPTMKRESDDAKVIRLPLRHNVRGAQEGLNFPGEIVDPKSVTSQDLGETFYPQRSGARRWNDASWLIFRNGLVQPPTRSTIWSNKPLFLSEGWWFFCWQFSVDIYRLMGQDPPPLLNEVLNMVHMIHITWFERVWKIIPSSWIAGWLVRRSSDYHLLVLGWEWFGAGVSQKCLLNRRSWPHQLLISTS